MNFSKVTNLQARAFLQQFFEDRNINREFYQRLPEDKFDYRMVDTPERKSDSPRENLGHQIGVEMDYLKALDTEELAFVLGNDRSLKRLSKEEQLKKLEELDKQLIEKLTDEETVKKRIRVPWSKEPVSLIAMLYAFNNHEVLHTGWNLAIMDHLNIERFPALKQMWG